MLHAVRREQPVQAGGGHRVELGQGWGLGRLEGEAQRLRGRPHAHVEEVVVFGQSLPDPTLLLGEQGEGRRRGVVPEPGLALLRGGVADRATDLGQVGEVLATVGDHLGGVLLTGAQAAREDEAERGDEEHASTDDALGPG